MAKIKLSPKMEDYLESISILCSKQRVARVKEISWIMGVKKPTTASAINTLVKAKLIIHEKYGYVQLTRKGKKLADEIQNKHRVLYKFLTNILSVSPKIAAKDACKMEHTVSSETFKKFSQYLKTHSK